VVVDIKQHKSQFKKFKHITQSAKFYLSPTYRTFGTIKSALQKGYFFIFRKKTARGVRKRKGLIVECRI